MNIDGIKVAAIVFLTLGADRLGRRLEGYIYAWRYEHQYRKAVRRMKSCSHQRTTEINLGTSVNPFMTKKCYDCYAFISAVDGKWTANSSSVEESLKVCGR